MDRCTAFSASYGQKEYLMMFYFSSFGLLHSCYWIPSLNSFLIRWFQMRLHIFRSEKQNRALWWKKRVEWIFSVTKIFFSDSKSMLSHIFQIFHKCFWGWQNLLAHIFQSRVLNAISLSAFWLNTAFKAVPFHHLQSTTISWLEHTSEIQAKVCFTFWSHSL